MDTGDELFPIGCLLSVQTTLDVEPVEGTVIAFDRPSSFLFLRTGRRTSVVNVNHIKDFTYLGREEDPIVVDRSYIYPGGFQDREDASIKQAQVEKDRIGVGVTEEAQSIFDALSKTLPVRWDETVIVVMNDVRVSSPYFSDNVSGGTPAANDRVKKVLELVREKLQVAPRGP